MTHSCPNCGRPVEAHAMFDPPRCPVVRLRFPREATLDPETAIVAFSNASSALPPSAPAEQVPSGAVLRGD